MVKKWISHDCSPHPNGGGAAMRDARARINAIKGVGPE